MRTRLDAEWILRKNTPYARHRELETLMEASSTKVHGSLLDTLYKQVNSFRVAADKSITSSKGVFDKLPFADDLAKTHKYLRENAKCDKELDVVELGVKNLKKLEKQFNEGYRVGSDVAILTYETMVMAVVDATSTLVTKTASVVVKTKDTVSTVSISALRRFNDAAKKGTIRKMLTESTTEFMREVDRDSVPVKEEFATIAGIGVLLVLASIPLIRELVFYFYYARMQLADYLDQLKMYIKINEVEVNNNPSFDAAKRKDIIKKQDEWIARLDNLSDRIRVKQSIGEKQSKVEIKKKDSEVTLDRVKQDISSSSTGFEFE